MSILYSPDSAYAKERCKWEPTRTEYGDAGRPFVYHEYPIMLTRASRPKQGGEPTFERVIADDDQGEANLLSRGFCRSAEDALAVLAKADLERARAAAERAYTDQRMSARAQAEAARADEMTSDHVGDVPETAIRRHRKKETSDE